jgi:hypothetical protein
MPTQSKPICPSEATLPSNKSTEANNLQLQLLQPINEPTRPRNNTKIKAKKKKERKQKQATKRQN